MIIDSSLCDAVFQSAYGLAKGRPGVPVKVSNIIMGTGLETADVAAALEALAKTDRISMSQTSDQIMLTRFGITVAKADVETGSAVVFADDRL